jgi:hypothetical protein
MKMTGQQFSRPAALFSSAGLALWLCAGCSGGPGDPPLTFFAVEATAPVAPIAGQPVQWSATLHGGAAPYRVSWNFGGGGVPDTLEETGISGASSTAETVMRPGQWIVTVTAFDSQGVISTDMQLCTVANTPPAAAVESAVYDSVQRRLRVRLAVTDENGDDVTVRLSAPGYLVEPAEQVVPGGGPATAEFIVSLADIFGGAPALDLELALDDGAETVISPAADGIDVSIDPLPMVAPDSLYAIPMKSVVAVDEPVRVLVVSTAPANPLRSCDIVLTCGAWGHPVAGSFNLGAPGGAPLAADGMWAALQPAGFAPVEDDFWTGFNGWLNYELGDGQRGFPFTLTPQGGTELNAAQGVLFSVEFVFTQPGVKTFGFAAGGKFGPTQYRDAAGTAYTWGDIANSTSGIPHSITVE